MSCFWSHDWVVLDSSTQSRENNKFSEEVWKRELAAIGKKPTGPRPIMTESTMPKRLENKVCLKCQGVDMQINKYREKLEAEFEIAVARMKKALNIIGEQNENISYRT